MASVQYRLVLDVKSKHDHFAFAVYENSNSAYQQGEGGGMKTRESANFFKKIKSAQYLAFLPQLLSTLCRWNASPWSPFNVLLSKQQAVSCLSNLSRYECKQPRESFRSGFVNRIIVLTVSATTSRWESSRRYPTEDSCGC